jgi:peptidoglycan/LPS O-acetylase OafA/YrhL
MVFFSIISYNLYLWHQWLEVKMKYAWHIPFTAIKDPHQNDPAWQVKYTLWGWVLTVTLATFITYVIERPLLRHGLKGVFKNMALLFSQPKHERNG